MFITFIIEHHFQRAIFIRQICTNSFNTIYLKSLATFMVSTYLNEKRLLYVVFVTCKQKNGYESEQSDNVSQIWASKKFDICLLYADCEGKKWKRILGYGIWFHVLAFGLQLLQERKTTTYWWRSTYIHTSQIQIKDLEKL